MTDAQRHEVALDLRTALRRSHTPLSDAIFLEASRLDSEDHNELISMRYASMDWVNGGDDRLLAIAPNGVLSALIHEEDHLRVQAILPGLQLENCLQTASAITNVLEGQLAFANLDEVGWLTASIPNCGTGMRAGVLMHLPALRRSGELAIVSRQLASEGFTVRGLYGEGTDSPGGFIQLSNATAFGNDPWPLAQAVFSAASKLATLERRARQTLLVGKESVRTEAIDAFDELLETDPLPRRILEIVSAIRLAIAEKVVPGQIEHTAEWVAIAGAIRRQEDPRQERFAAMRNAAQLRAKLRSQLPQIK